MRQKVRHFLNSLLEKQAVPFSLSSTGLKVDKYVNFEGKRKQHISCAQQVSLFREKILIKPREGLIISISSAPSILMVKKWFTGTPLRLLHPEQ